MQNTDEDRKASGRASPLSVEERQSMIIDAVIPLILERGRNVSTRHIAEACGIAEGTIFRAFGDKESLISAAIERLLDPTPMHERLGRLDPELPLQDKVQAILELLQERFAEVFRLMAMFEQTEHRRPHEHGRHEYAGIVARALQPDLDRLNLPAERVGPVIRLIAFSSSIPRLTEAVPFTLDELTRFVLYGIAGHPAGHCD